MQQLSRALNAFVLFLPDSGLNPGCSQPSAPLQCVPVLHVCASPPWHVPVPHTCASPAMCASPPHVCQPPSVCQPPMCVPAPCFLTACPCSLMLLFAPHCLCQAAPCHSPQARPGSGDTADAAQRNSASGSEPSCLCHVHPSCQMLPWPHRASRSRKSIPARAEHPDQGRPSWSGQSIPARTQHPNQGKASRSGQSIPARTEHTGMTHHQGLGRQSLAQLPQEWQQGHLWYHSTAQALFCNGSGISFLPQLAPDYQCPRAPFQSLFNAPLIIHFSDSRNAARG